MQDEEYIRKRIHDLVEDALAKQVIELDISNTESEDFYTTCDEETLSHKMSKLVIKIYYNRE
jgi:hypothetical protein